MTYRCPRLEMLFNHHPALLPIVLVAFLGNASCEFLFESFPDGFEWGVSSADIYIENSLYFMIMLVLYSVLTSKHYRFLLEYLK